MTRPATRDPAGDRDPSTVAGGTSLLALDTCMKAAPQMARHQRRPLYVLEDTTYPGQGYVAPASESYSQRYRIVARVSNQGQVVGQVNGIAPREEHERPTETGSRPNGYERDVEQSRPTGLAPELMNLELSALMALLTELRQTAMSLVDQAPPGYDIETLVEAIGAAEDTCGEIVMLADDE